MINCGIAITGRFPHKTTTVFSFFFVYGSTVLWTLAAFSVSLSYTQSVGILGRGISPSQGRYLQTEQPEVGLEPTISVFEPAKTVHVLDRAAIVFGSQK
jgi:hypothetical protein